MINFLPLMVFAVLSLEASSKPPLRIRRAVEFGIRTRSLFLQQVAYDNYDYHALKKFNVKMGEKLLATIFLKASGVSKPTDAQRQQFLKFWQVRESFLKKHSVFDRYNGMYQHSIGDWQLHPPKQQYWHQDGWKDYPPEEKKK